MQLNFQSIVELARELRKNQTPAEKILWNELRGRKLNGLKFLRQHPIIHAEYPENPRTHFYIADFYCYELKLVVELDGKIHDHQKEYDMERDAVLNGKGLNVLRIENEEVKKIEKVKNKILSFL